MKKLFISIILLYKKTVSPLLLKLFGGGCRYSPTCSDYFIQAIGKYGIIEGSFKGVKRILTCHPFSKKPTFDPLD
ncbi:MAG TPA: membrane protein insertion efficiency factor YidD [Patescibacteria group bacterium]|nr:membrane protein insertion efficiency factor YidD [Patescibacteria group bacterium]